MPVDVDRVAELAGQNDGAPGKVVEQNDSTIAAVVGFTGLPLPGAIVALEVEGGLLEDVPVVGECFDVLNADSIRHGRRFQRMICRRLHECGHVANVSCIFVQCQVFS
jgi:hypothetical protein